MKPKGTGLILVGFALILGALALTVYNTREAENARESANTVLDAIIAQIPAPTEAPQTGPQGDFPQLQPDYVRYPNMEMPVVNMDGQDYVAAISIPSLDLELPVISQWSYPALKIAPCRYLGSAYTDDLILMAHNYASHFGRIKELRPGDSLQLKDMDGNLFTYEVVELETLDGTAVEDMEAGDWDLTLFTCTYGGKSRVTVRCERTDAE
jgi:sortase A